MRKRKSSVEPKSDSATGGSDDVAAIADNADNGGNADIGVSEAIAATVDPATIELPVGDDAPEQPRRGRGRPPGSSGKSANTKKASNYINVTGLEKLLVGIHGGLALMTGRMELALDTDSKIFDGQTEAEFLAKSMKDVAAHYGGVMDQKTLDWMNLIQCAAIVYGGRLYAIRSTPRAPRPQRPPSPQEAARSHRAAPPMQTHVTAPPVNSFSPVMDGDSAGRVDIAGVGAVELPDDHPLSPNYKPRWNN